MFFNFVASCNISIQLADADSQKRISGELGVTFAPGALPIPAAHAHFCVHGMQLISAVIIVSDVSFLLLF